ncbi:MAG: phosphodiester glycosidase family protein [Solirubrobacteraceae bacterium]
MLDPNLLARRRRRRASLLATGLIVLGAPAVATTTASAAAEPTPAAEREPLSLVDTTEKIGPGVTLRHVKTVKRTALRPSANGTSWYDYHVLTADLANGVVSSDLLTGEHVTSTGAISGKADKAGAVAGINGDFFDIGNSGAPHGIAIKGGELLKGQNQGSWGNAGVGQDGIGRTMVDVSLEAKATFGGTEHPIATLNAPNVNSQAPAGSIVAFTPHWGATSRARGVNGATDIAEVLVRDGKVVSVNPTGAGAEAIAKNELYLVGREAGAEAIRALEPGDDVALTYGLKDEIAKQLKFAVGGNRELVRDGEIVPQTDHSIAPRTLIGFKDGGRTMIMVTADGRQAPVDGLTFPEAADLMHRLGAESAVNLDGGGSTTMVARRRGNDRVSVRNSPSDGVERADPNGVGVFVAPGSGKAEELVLTPDEPKVFPGMHRTLDVKAVDSNAVAVPVARGDVRWSAKGGTVSNGLVGAPADAKGTIDVRSTIDGAQTDTKVRVLGPLASLELSSNRLSIPEMASSPVTLRVTGRDVHGYTTPIEATDLDLEYDRSVVRITPDGHHLRVTPHGDGGTVLQVKVAGEEAKLPITVGVETKHILDFEQQDVGDPPKPMWKTSGTAGTAKTLANSPDGLKLTYAKARNFGFTANGSGPEVQPALPGQPLRVRLSVHSTQAVEMSYVTLRQGDGSYVGLYGPSIKPGWQDITVTLPTGTEYPLSFDAFQGIETNGARQADGELTIKSLEVDVAADVEIPPIPALRPDRLVSPDGRTNGEDDWSYATFSDIQFTATDPTLAKVGIAGLERVRATDAEVVVLNGDITDFGEAADVEIARDTLEAGGCQLVPFEQEIGKQLPASKTDESIPCLYVPGNHESYIRGSQGTLDQWKAEFGDAYGTFDHKGTRLILLNSALGNLRGSDFEQLAMLEAALADAATNDDVRNVAVFAHHPTDDPAETKSSQLTDRTEVELLRTLLGDFREKSGKGVSMTGSHAQIAHVDRVEGVPFSVLTSTGKSPYGTPDRGGFTGWTRWAVDRDADADGQWLTADVRAFAQEITLNAPEDVEVGTSSELSGSIVQPSGVQPGSRVVPLTYPMSVRWGGDDALAIGSGSAAADRARQAGKVAILDPVTRKLTGLRTGEVTVSVTNDSMREFTDEASLAPITTEETIQVVANTGPGPKVAMTQPVFAEQPQGSISTPQPITITNDGDQALKIERLSIEAADEGSKGEFLLADGGRTPIEVAPGQSHVVLVRYAPGRENVTSSAELVIADNTAAREHRVTLTGTSLPPNTGKPGEDGQDGAPGEDGQDGQPGQVGAPGQDGAQGPKGDTGGSGAQGLKGDNGTPGPQGPVGATGAQGPKGDKGADGTLSFTTKRTKTAVVRRGRLLRLGFTVRNTTTARVGRSTAKVTVPKRLKVSGRRTLRVKTLRAGQARSVNVRLRVSRKARRGTHTVRVQLKVGGRTVTNRVKVRVR